MSGARGTRSKPRRTSNETRRRETIPALCAETARLGTQEESAQHGSKNATHATDWAIMQGSVPARGVEETKENKPPDAAVAKITCDATIEMPEP